VLEFVLTAARDHDIVVNRISQRSGAMLLEPGIRSFLIARRPHPELRRSEER
jgi:hypothetical protein